jgi:cytochrome P450
MTSPGHATDFLHDLRRRSAQEGGVFWVDDDRLAVFEPAAAREVNRANWHGLVMPDRLVDVIRRRRSAEVRWTTVRGAWLTRLRELTTAEHNTTMMERMSRVLESRLGADVDLVMLAQEIAVETILPVIITGLTAKEAAHISEDVNQKLIRLVARRPLHGMRDRWHFAAVQIRAGRIVRRVLRQRASGRRARQLDLADAVVDLLPRLGIGRGMDAVSTILTAVGGPPGSAAASLLYELTRQPVWAARVAEELRGLDAADFAAAPTRTAPLTHRFIKEVLRLWSPPLVLVRPARVALDVGTTRLAQGRTYLLSPHVMHRDPRYWSQADTFDPDRFLPGAPHGPAGRGHYMPFGWAPKACVGAEIGTIQLMVLAFLLCTRFRLDVPDIDQVTMVCRFAPVPEPFRGTLTRRP